MSSNGCSAEGGLRPRITGDGSFSLYSVGIGEGFHRADGALGEARGTYVRPAELQRHPAGRELWVVDVGVGLGTNSAALLEAASERGLRLRWFGLENDPEPLRLALEHPRFRGQWGAAGLDLLMQLRDRAVWSGRHGCGRLLPGDARATIRTLSEQAAGRCDLVLMDAFSPQRCPQLWSLEFLAALAGLLRPDGRLLTYSSAAAVRGSLQRAGLQLASIHSAGGRQGSGIWSEGTAASPFPLPTSAWLRPLSAMEREHLASRAGEPYRDPLGHAEPAAILAARRRAQACSGAEPAGRWRRRWELGTGGAPIPAEGSR